MLAGDKKSPRNEFLYYTSRGDLEGIRKDKWKLLVKKKRKPRNAGKNWKAPAPEILLFDIIADMGEKTNLANEHPQKVQELTGRMENLDAEITKNSREPWYKQ